MQAFAEGMKAVRKLLLGVLLMLGTCASAGAQPSWLSSVSDGLARAENEKRLLFLEIVRSKSPLCARPDTEKPEDPRLAGVLERYILVRLDADRAPEEAARWNPISYPTHVVLQADGTEVARPPGTLTASELAGRLEEILADEQALGEHLARLAREPLHVGSQIALARLYLRRGNAAAAQPLVEALARSTAVEARAALPALWLNLGMALGKGGPSPKGRKCFERVTCDFPDSREATQAHFLLYMIYLMQGNRDAAARSLEKILDGTPDQYLRERAERALRRLNR